MEVNNYSAEPLNKVYGWLPHDLEAEKVIFFPDACPGKSPLPTGTVVFTKQENWRKNNFFCFQIMRQPAIHFV